MTRENRRATRPSDSKTALVNLEFFDEKDSKWKPAPTRHSFLTDELARKYASHRYASGISIRTSEDARISVTGAQ